MEKVYRERPNFLGSEVGLVTKTITVPTSATHVVEDGRTIVKAGTIFTTPYYGLLFKDVDITDGAKQGSLMVGGYYIDAKLPSTASAQVNNFAKTGLFPITEGTTTRPAFGDGGLPALTAPAPSATKAAVAWTAVTDAVGYRVYDKDKKVLVEQTAVTYTATATGTYYVQAVGDNINHKSSGLASVTVTALA